MQYSMLLKVKERQAEFEGFDVVECFRRTVQRSRILQILPRTESFAQRIFKDVHGMPEVPRILCAQYLAGLLKLAQ